MRMPFGLFRGVVLVLLGISAAGSRAYGQNVPPITHIECVGNCGDRGGERPRPGGEGKERNDAYNRATHAYNTGLALYKKGDYAKAEPYFRQSIVIYPDASGYRLLGYVLQLQKRVPEAIAAYENALRYDPNDKGARANLDSLRQYMSETNREREADRAFQEGLSLEGQKKYADAEAYFRRVLGMCGTPHCLAVAYAHLGYVLDFQGKVNEAIAAYKSSLEYDPQDQTTLINLDRAQKQAAARERFVDVEKNVKYGVGVLADTLHDQQVSASAATAASGLQLVTSNAAISTKSTVEQLSSIAHSSKRAAQGDNEFASGKARCGLDTSACERPDSLAEVPAPSASGLSPAVVALAKRIPPVAEARRDPQIRQSFAWFQHLEGLKADAEKKIAETQQQLEKGAGDPPVLKAQIATLTNQVNQYKRDEETAEQQIKKRVVDLGLQWNENPQPESDGSKPH